MGKKDENENYTARRKINQLSVLQTACTGCGDSESVGQEPVVVETSRTSGRLRGSFDFFKFPFKNQFSCLLVLLMY